jgi:triacylglycerol esterase/lipase EstA (alpha/beta hydrolase family)
LVFVVGVLVLALALAAAVVVPRLRGTTTVLGVPQDQLGPVVLVPGYGGGTDALEVLAEQLRAVGRDAVVVRLPGDATGDLRQQADALDGVISQELRGGAPSVDLVGFSAGGVVARLWVDRHDGERKARRVVTLGSPHHGTDVAALALRIAPASCPVACQQLRPDSDVLRGLNDGDETPDGPQWVSVWTTLDEIVTPPDTARLDGAVDVRLQSVCPDARTAHGALPTDPLVQGVVLRALDTDVLDAAPSAEECGALRALSGGGVS